MPEGSVRRVGGRLRVVVQLISVADGFHLWSERHMLLVHLRAFIDTIGWLSRYRSMLDEYGL